LLQTFITLAVYWLVVLIGGALILVSLGFSIMPMFAVVGGVSFILAFALQETLGNFAAGLMILVYRPFDLGERVTVAGVTGEIRYLSLASTIVTTPDNQLVTIPNSKVWNDVITNFVDLDTRRVDLSFVIREPMKAMDAIEHLGELLGSLPEVLGEPEASYFIGKYDGRGATLEIRPWVKSEEYATARRSITRAIMRYFIDRKIELWVPAIEDQGSA
jgi:small conductance mechanosensitive channel